MVTVLQNNYIHLNIAKERTLFTSQVFLFESRLLGNTSSEHFTPKILSYIAIYFEKYILLIILYVIYLVGNSFTHVFPVEMLLKEIIQNID